MRKRKTIWFLLFAFLLFSLYFFIFFPLFSRGPKKYTLCVRACGMWDGRTVIAVHN